MSDLYWDKIGFWQVVDALWRLPMAHNESAGFVVFPNSSTCVYYGRCVVRRQTGGHYVYYIILAATLVRYEKRPTAVLCQQSKVDGIICRTRRAYRTESPPLTHHSLSHTHENSPLRPINPIHRQAHYCLSLYCSYIGSFGTAELNPPHTTQTPQ